MTTSPEAFKQFYSWRDRKTSLRITSIVKGNTKEILVARIDALDLDALQLGIIVDETREHAVFDVEGLIFAVEPARVVVTRNESDWLIFEEHRKLPIQ